MTYIKIDTEFLPLEAVARDSQLPVEVIEDCVNFDLMSNDFSDGTILPEVANKIRRFKVFCALRRADIPASLRNYIIEISEKYPSNKAVSLAKKEMELCSIDSQKSKQILESFTALLT
ncbi:hypothetical protein KC622_02020 [Candidatus Dojkabacteria bacterium]|uniref:Uncharacterized protein n=1 Tax=Candidatus Dojkabacteria bacterium TaxID=2099670 RepID=A0A955I5X0_9BACT|nr:hypothetical protein [Candidatus Dojkabacteria bacterium]MCB9790730.1 hypothetical protein [Candidatus Nomurabacteria bacterium]